MASSGMSEQSLKIVAAIEIGTPFSGYAYSRCTTFQKEPLRIQQKEQWHPGSKNVLLATCLLLDNKLDFIAFGYDALEQYGQLKQLGRHRNHFLFRNFNLQLYDRKEPLMTFQLSDVDGHGKILAKHVFASSIRSLKDELLQQFDSEQSLINESEILWVLTTCCGWSDDSKFFIEECAKQAGIPAEQLMVVYEHEAASVYSQYIERDTSYARIDKIGFDKVNVEYVLVKLAGNAVQTMVLRKTADKKIALIEDFKEVTLSDVGNDMVDSEFWKILISICGSPTLNKIRDDKPNSYMKLFRNFNTIKTVVTPDTKDFISVSFPCKVFNEVLQKYSKESFEKCLLSSERYKELIKADLSDKLVLHPSIIVNCFNSIVEHVFDLLQRAFQSKSENNIQYILLVGHLSESVLVQNAIRQKFRRKTLVVPEHGSVAILKGAVLIGHAPTVVGLDPISNIGNRNRYLGVVAIDFGTAFSGYAYSTVDKYEESPLKITVKTWPGRETNHKTATSVLFDEYKRFVKFGSGAQDEYTKQTLKRQSYYYFENFKMNLYNNKTPLGKLQLMDIQNKQERKLLAKDIFSAAIRFLKDDAIKELEKCGTKVRVDEIRWVLTVPAIWPDDAKMFMRESAKQAGIHPEKLLIALEPEAASVYVQWQETKESTEGGFNVTPPGTKYLVADVGGNVDSNFSPAGPKGGTTDITVHEKLPNGKLKELNKASGDGCGGKAVDQEFFRWLDKKFGIDIMDKFKTEYPKPYLDLRREFENVKRTVNSKTSSDKHLKFPCSSFFKIKKGQEDFEKYCKLKEINIVDGKLVLDSSTLKELFQPTINRIISNIEQALKIHSPEQVSMIILVGGFAKSDLLKTAIKTKFEGKKIIVPEDASLAVLKGAVMYGHNPETIDPRVTRFTYGVEMSSPFKEGIHEPSRLIRGKFGMFYCRGTFDVIIKQNKTVKLGTVIKKTYTVPPYTTTTNVEFYAAEKDEPLYTDDPCCRKVGTLVISIPLPSEETRHVDVEYIFGNTEIGVRAKETKYKKEASAILTFD